MLPIRLKFVFLALFLALFSSNIAFSSVVSPSGGGSGGGASTTQGIGGGATNTVGADSIVNVKNYGATANGVIKFDGSMPVAAAMNSNAGSTSPSAPAVTTSVNNDVVLSIIGYHAATLTPPGTPTQRVSEAETASTYGLFMGDQTKATAGSVPAQTGTITSADWVASSIMLAPTSGNTITFTAAVSGHIASGSALVLNVPTGTTNGMLMIECNTLFGASVPAGTAVTAWTFIGSVVTSAESMFCYERVAASEPASYTFNSQGGSGQTGFIASYANVQTIDDLFTSAGASFVAGDLNKPICAAKMGGTTQSCGTISQVVSGTTILSTMVNSTSATVSTAWYQYGTASTCAQMGFSALGNGVTHIHVPAGVYQLTTSCTVPAGTSLVFDGDGRSSVNWGFATGGTTVNNANLGTYISWLTTSLTNPAILVNPASTNGVNANVFSFKMANFTMWGGVGVGQDGGGSDGLKFISAPWIGIDNVTIGNFTGVGLNNQGGGGSGYADATSLTNFWSMLNGTDGLQLGGFNEDVFITNSQFDNNKNNGINIVSGPVEGFHVIDSNIQRNNTANIGSNTFQQIKTASTISISGCQLTGDYFEDDGGQTAPATNADSWTGCFWNSNTFIAGAAFVPTFAGSSTLGLQACAAKYAGIVQNVTDALACKPGATYAAAGGSSTCQVSCSTSNTWVFTGGAGGTAGALALTGGSVISSTGGAIPTATCSGGSTGVSIAAGSTNNRGQITTSSSASTNCTITWSAASTWPQAPFCTVTDGAASITPTGVSVGATGTSTMVIDFASASSKVFNWLCM